VVTLGNNIISELFVFSAILPVLVIDFEGWVWNEISW